MRHTFMILLLFGSGTLPFAFGQERDEEPAVVEIVGTTAYAETLPEGQTVVGARVELPAEVDATGVTLTTFAATGYDVIGTYTNNTGTWNDAAPRGRYVFVKFAVDPVPGYATGKTLQYFGDNLRLPIRLDLRQNEQIILPDGRVVNPSGFINTSGVNLLADDFRKVSFTDSTGFDVKYRLFIPKGYEERNSDLENLPIVIFFHGAGEGGFNNDVQLLGNPSALEFATPEAQAEHPAFVMAPQNLETWAEDTGTEENPFFEEGPSLRAAIEALNEVAATYNIDKNRIYGTGLSQGSRGLWAASIAHPDLFAAQLNIASADIYTNEQLRPLVNKPIWTLVSADDTEERVTGTNGVVDQLESLGAGVDRNIGDEALNGYLRGFEANREIQAQWNEAEEQAANVLLTHFVPGTVLPDPHWSWMYAFNNEVLHDWLFSQRK